MAYKYIYFATYLSFLAGNIYASSPNTQENITIQAQAQQKQITNCVLQPVTEIPALQAIILGYLDSWHESHILATDSIKLNQVASSPDGHFVAYITQDNKICLWNTCTETKAVLDIDSNFAPTALAYSPDGNYLAIGIFEKPKHSDKFSLIIYDINKREIADKFRCTYGEIIEIAYSPDGNKIAYCPAKYREFAGVTRRGIVITEIKTKQTDYLDYGNANTPYRVKLSPTENYLVMAPIREYTAQILDSKTGRLKARLRGNNSFEIFSLAYSPNGNYLACAQSNNTVRIWNTQEKSTIEPDEFPQPTLVEPFKTLNGHTADVNAVTFSSDGQYIATGSADQTVRIWDFATSKELHTLSGHTDLVHTVGYSSDGNCIISASKDNSVRVWTNTAQVIRQAKQIKPEPACATK